MSALPPSGGSADIAGSPLDLETVFSHPEGLSAARSIVEELLRSAGKTMAYTQPPHTPASFVATHAMSGSNPTMPEALRAMLAFSKSQVQPLEGGNECGSRGETGRQIESLERPDTSRVKIMPYPTGQPTDRRRQPYSLSPLEAFSCTKPSSDLQNKQSSLAYYQGNAAKPSMQYQLLERPSTLGTATPFTDHMDLDSPTQLTLQSSASSHTMQPTTWASVSRGIHNSISQLPTIQTRPPQATYKSIRPASSGRPLKPLAPLLPSEPSSPQMGASSELSQIQSNAEVLYVQEPPLHRSYPQIACRPEGALPAKEDKPKAPKKTRKRKNGEDEKAVVKKPRTNKEPKPKRAPKSKVEKAAKDQAKAKYQLNQDIWMRILEFTPPSFLAKARLISTIFKGYVDNYKSIYNNCRIENFGYDMPPPPPGLTATQYNNLLNGSKGCLEPGCPDKKAARTHWPWQKRWCQACWKSKIEREDRVFKNRTQHARSVLVKMLECIPVGMHDSFMKPHDYVDDVEVRPRGAPRLYKYYLTQDIERIVAQYESLNPPPYVEDPNQSATEKAAAASAHQALMDKLEEKRNEFFAAEKAKNDAHMAIVQKIEAGIRTRRQKNSVPHDANRAKRRALFLRRAAEDIFETNPGMDENFVETTQAFKQATRIFRDGGTERGWQALKPKILKAWQDKQAGTGSQQNADGGEGAETSRLGSAEVIDLDNDDYQSPTPPDFEDSQLNQPFNNNGPYARPAELQAVEALESLRKNVPSAQSMSFGQFSGHGLPPMMSHMPFHGNNMGYQHSFTPMAHHFGVSHNIFNSVATPLRHTMILPGNRPAYISTPSGLYQDTLVSSSHGLPPPNGYRDSRLEISSLVSSSAPDYAQSGHPQQSYVSQSYTHFNQGHH